MIIERLRLQRFRNHQDTEICLDPRLTLVTGPNGHGKTNLLEAIDLLGGRRSFRGARIGDLLALGGGISGVPSGSSGFGSVGGGSGGVRGGATGGAAGTTAAARVSARIRSGERTVDLVLEFLATEATKATLNANNIGRLAELAEVVQTVVFTPADLALVQGAPAQRRQLLDDVAGTISREYRQQRLDLDKVLRQRNMLLKQSRHRLDETAERTLEVWDTQLVECATAVGNQRAGLVTSFQPVVRDYYCQLAAAPAQIVLEYQAPWRAVGLADALVNSRREDLRRGTTTVGPQRDDVAVVVDGMAAGTHCSQGEQRSLVLALRLAQHRRLVETFADPPVVLLDDVFSELDEQRAKNLVNCLPECQIVITSATGSLPDGISVGTRVELRNGAVQRCA